MREKCINCGGKVIFSPRSRGSKCLSCGSVFPIEYAPYFGKKRFENIEDVEVDKLKGNVKAVRCSGCGVNLILTEEMVTGKCPYCGKAMLGETKQGTLNQIDSIIPFEFGRKEALKKFKATVKKRVFANSKLFKGVTTKDMTGIYVNSIFFDLGANIKYDGVLERTVSVTNADGTTSLETERKHVSGKHYGELENFPVSGDSFPNLAFAEIAPYNFSGAVAFEEDFLTGFSLEYKDKLFKDCFSVAERHLKSKSKDEILEKYGYDRVVKMDLDIQYVSKKYNYCLLPVYLYNSEYKGKKYVTIQNGQTGKVGKIPKSPLKLLLLLGGCTLFVAAIILLIALL